MLGFLDNLLLIIFYSFFQITRNDDDEKKAMELLPEMLELMKVAYDRVENLYTIHKLHDLP